MNPLRTIFVNVFFPKACNGEMLKWLNAKELMTGFKNVYVCVCALRQTVQDVFLETAPSCAVPYIISSLTPAFTLLLLSLNNLEIKSLMLY